MVNWETRDRMFRWTMWLTIYPLLFVALIYGVLAYACEAVASEGGWYVERPRDGVMFVGDSITTGIYPEVVHDLLVQGSGRTLGYSKLATVGISIAKVHEYFDEMLAKDGEFLMSHMVVYGGLNDCLRGSASRRVTDYLEHMILTANTFGIEMVILNLHVKSRCSEEVNDWLNRAQWFMDFQLVDTTFLRERTEPRMVAGDGVHLTRWGNHMLGRRVHEQVEWGGGMGGSGDHVEYFSGDE